TNHDLSNTVIMQLSHTLSANTFYTIGASYIDKTHQYYLYQDPTDPRYVNPQDALLLDSYSFQTGGTDMTNYDRETRTAEIKFDISSQMDQTNLVKGGVEFRHHRLYERNITLQPIQSELSFNPATSDPFITPTVLPESSLAHSEYTHEPTEFSAYIQDKMEFKDIIVNIGVRWDYFQPDGEVLSDPTDPNIYAPLKPNNQFFDYNGDGIQESNEPTKTLADRQAYWYKKASAKSQFSPRLGVSFPITATGIVHFSYGHFFQIPRFERLYENPDFKIGSNTGYAGNIGNADLQPEETINAELGLQEQLTDDIGTDVTAYFRDIRNLTGTGTDDEVITFDPSRYYVRYANKDFGLVKGIVLTITKRFSQGMTATADYTYQIARGTASDPLETANAIAGGTLPQIQLNPLQWDQRHTLNVTWSYSPHPWGVSFIGKYGSGNPYTPVGSVDITSLLTNSANMPSFFDLDTRAFYEFPLNPFKAMVFLRVFNLLNTRNEVQVYPRSGSADYTPDEYFAIVNNLAKQQANTVQQYYTNPTFYSEPRRIEFGCNLEF
ncbi:MAG TPA: TonB-dependent receptor, partial [Bacteroidota bacterium]|nr:TonB-dependent receptor [Bacteroidota bacterium]